MIATRTTLTGLFVALFLLHVVSGRTGQHITTKGSLEDFTVANKPECKSVDGEMIVGWVFQEKSAPSASKCCVFCHNKCDPSHTMCVGWSYEESSGNCQLFSDIFYIAPRPGFERGISDCSSPYSS